MNKNFWRYLIRLTFLLLLAFGLQSCGGGGGGGSDGGTNLSSNSSISSSASSVSPISIDGKLVISENNANYVVRNALDSTAIILKLVVQLQEAVDAFVIAQNDSFEFTCETAGTIKISWVSEIGISVNFLGCENSRLEEKFNGLMTIYPESIYSNRADEVLLSGLAVIDKIELNGLVYSSISGSFNYSQQATWHGDTLIITENKQNLLKMVRGSVTNTVEDISVTLEYDLDEGRQFWPRSNFFTDFDISIHSSDYNSAYACKSSKAFGIGEWNPTDFEIYCGGSGERTLKLTEHYLSEIDVSILEPNSQAYRVIFGAFWGEFKPLYKYQPGYPQPSFEIPQIAPVAEFKMPINDSVYSASREKIYITTPSTAKDYPNHLIEFDLKDGTVTRHLALNGEPNEIAISPDESVLYVGYLDLNKVHKINLDSFTSVSSLDLGTDLFSGPRYATEIAISPESNDVVAVSVFVRSGEIINQNGLRFFRNGIDQSIVVWNDPTRMLFNDTGDRLISYSDNSTGYNFDVYRIDPSGPKRVINLNGYAEGPSEIYRVGDVLYHGIGSAINPYTGEILGRYKVLYGFDNETYRKLAPLISPDSKYAYIYAQYLEIFDKDRFTHLGVFDPKIEGKFLRLYNVADNKFAFISDSGIKIFSHDEVEKNEDWECQPFSFPDIRVKINIDRISCSISDAVYSPQRKQIFAAIPGSAGVNGNSIAVINSDSLAIESYIQVGSEPVELELSANHKNLFVAYSGANKYSVVDLENSSIALNVNLRDASNPGNVPVDLTYFDWPQYAGDIEPFPDDDDSVVIALRNRLATTEFEGLAVYTNGVKAEKTILPRGLNSPSTRIKFTGSNKVIGYNNDHTGFELSEFYVDHSGVSNQSEFENLISGFSNELAFSNGKLYSSLGYVVDTNEKKLLAKMEGLETDNFTRHQFVIDESRRVMYLYAAMLLKGNDPVLKVYSLDTYKELTSVKMPVFSVLLGEPTALINLDDHRLLVVLENFTYVLDKDEIWRNAP
jgi:hypothetical protein